MFSFPTQGGRAEEARLPLIARLTLYALGAVEGRRIRRPMDPVAAWLIRTHPALLHSESAPAAFTTIRARTSVIDSLLSEDLGRAKDAGETVNLVTIGGSFDARWYRLLPLMGHILDGHYEIETPGLLSYKNQLLNDSPYSGLWTQVIQSAQPEQTWSIPQEAGSSPIIIMEGLAGRLEPAALRQLLAGVAESAPGARVLIGLPGYSGNPGAWSDRRLSALGWRVDADVRLSPRGRLVSQAGKEICAGMHGLRVLRLVRA